MDVISLAIIIVVIIIIYKYCNIPNKDNTTENKDERLTDTESTESTESIKPIKKTKKTKKIKKTKASLNPYFTENQFHTDYRDTQNAFQIMVPDQKQLFNRSDLPLKNVSTTRNKDIVKLVKSFIKEVNKTIDNDVTDGITSNNWKNSYGERDFKSGWEKQQEKLGLPGSLYTKPAKKAHIRLIKVDRSEKYETDDEIRYTVFMTVQKVNVKTQMVLRVNFYMDNHDPNADRDFFNKEKTHDTKIMIEEIFVIGFLTKESFGKPSVKTQYQEFDGITDGRMFDQEEIIKQLNKKRRQYEKECARQKLM